MKRFTLKRNKANEAFKWYFNYEFKDGVTWIRLYFKFKNQQSIEAIDLSRFRYVSIEEAKEFAENYLRIQGWLLRKFIWLGKEV